MGQPVVHSEAIGRDPKALQRHPGPEKVMDRVETCLARDLEGHRIGVRAP